MPTFDLTLPVSQIRDLSQLASSNRAHFSQANMDAPAPYIHHLATNIIKFVICELLVAVVFKYLSSPSPSLPLTVVCFEDSRCLHTTQWLLAYSLLTMSDMTRPSLWLTYVRLILF